MSVQASPRDTSTHLHVCACRVQVREGGTCPGAHEQGPCDESADSLSPARVQDQAAKHQCLHRLQGQGQQLTGVHVFLSVRALKGCVVCVS